MVKTLIVPTENILHIEIPNNYIGKEVEILLYAKEELIDNKIESKKKASDFKNIFTKEEGKLFDTYISKIRNEWDRNI
jgi:hypothetical protein